MCSSGGSQGSPPCGVPPFGDPRLTSLRAAPRGISLLRHVLHRHERPRHPPDALCHGRTTRQPRGRPRRPRPVPRPLPAHPSSLAAALRNARSLASLSSSLLARKVHRSRPRLLPAYRQAANGDDDRKRGGGDEETRTPDPLRAKEVLSQLSYIPTRRTGGRLWIRTRDLTLIRGVL